MSEFEKLKVVTRYELLKQFRRRRFHGALAVAIIAVVLMIGLYQGLDLPGRLGFSQFVDEYGAELFAMFAINIGALVALAAVFFAGDAIAGEFEDRTGYILFPNPVKRTTLVVGKYLACVIAATAILAVIYIMSAAAVLVFYGQVPVGMLGSLAVTFMFVCFMTSLAFAFSSVLKGGTGATIAALLTFMVVFMTVSSLLSAAGYDPWFMPDRAQETMSAAYGVPLVEVAAGMFGGLTTGLAQASQDTTLGILVLLGYALVLLNVSIWAAKRREMI